MSCFFLIYVTGAVKKQKSSITLASFYPVTGQTDNCVSSTSYKPFDSKPFILCEHFHIRRTGLRGSVADWWSCLFLCGVLLRAFARNQQYIFMPLLTSFSECIHVCRFRLRCSHTVLYIHYNFASQHWETAAPNYGLFYTTS